jgi:alkylation response protein AidB-like acyl-CoA dehydrogenase
MDFKTTRTQKDIQKAAWEFAKGHFDSQAVIEMDKQELYPREVCEKAGELGFIGLTVPEAYGGGDFGFIEMVLVEESLCRKDSTMGIALGMADAFSESLYLFGTEDIKQLYLSSICQGKMLCGFSLDDLYPDTIADDNKCNLYESGDQLEITGNKTMVVNSPIADIYFIVCREIHPSSLDDANSLIIVKKEGTNFSAKEIQDRLGIRLTGLGECSFDRTCVPSNHRLGRKGRAPLHIRKILPTLHVRLAAMALGISQGCLDRALDYTKQRIQFGKKIGQFQVVRHKLAQMAIHVEQARSLTYRAASLLDTGQKDTILSAAAKLCACNAALHVAYEAIQLHGGYGYMTEYGVERFYRDAKMLQIIAGNTHQLKDMIANQVIGKIK